jgi:hypothetical protein
VYDLPKGRAARTCAVSRIEVAEQKGPEEKDDDDDEKDLKVGVGVGVGQPRDGNVEAAARREDGVAAASMSAIRAGSRKTFGWDDVQDDQGKGTVPLGNLACRHGRDELEEHLCDHFAHLDADAEVEEHQLPRERVPPTSGLDVLALI